VLTNEVEEIDVYVPRNLGIYAILRLHCAFSESWICVPISRLRSQSWDCAIRLRNLKISLLHTVYVAQNPPGQWWVFRMKMYRCVSLFYDAIAAQLTHCPIYRYGSNM